MKLGLMTAAFPRLTLEKLAFWSAENGYEMIEVACWPSSKGRQRRYAGVCHIDVDALDVDRVASMLERTGLEISSLAYYPNNLHPDPVAPPRRERPSQEGDRRGREARDPDRRHVRRAGPVEDRPGQLQGVPQGLAAARRLRGQRGITIAIENCPMLFSYDEWPGGLNLASTPAAWDEMFSICDAPNFGLNLDPSHLVWQMIDHDRVVRDYALEALPRPREGHGDRPGGPPAPRRPLARAWAGRSRASPGSARSTGAASSASCIGSGYDGVVSVEHEDRAFEGTDELVKRGFEIARDALAPYIV